MSGQSQGAFTQLAIDGKQMEFLSISGGAITELVDNGEQAIRGILDHVEERVTQGLSRYALRIVMQPSPTELDTLLPLMGFTESPTDTFTVAETYTTFTTIVDRVAKVHTYTNCKIDKWIYSGQKGSTPVTLTLFLLAEDETEGASGSFSATALDTDIAYAFHEATGTLQGAAEVFDRFAIIGDAHMAVQHNNSRKPTSIAPTQRTIHLAVSTPYTSDESALYTTPYGSAAGGTASIVLTRSDRSTTFTFANAKVTNAKPPDIPGKTEIRLSQVYKAYKSGSTASLVITHDNTAA